MNRTFQKKLNGLSLLATTRPRNDDGDYIATTAWSRDHIGEPSSNLTIFKCGAVDLPQNVTRYLGAVGTTANATETNRTIEIFDPTEIFEMKVYLSEAVPESEMVTITLRKEAADTSMATTITGPTSAGAVVPVTGSVIFGRTYAVGSQSLSVKTVTSATFGSTNDIVVTLLARVPHSNYKPVSSFALASASPGATNWAGCGEFCTLIRTRALLSSAITDAELPLPNTVARNSDGTATVYVDGSSGNALTAANHYLPSQTTICMMHATSNTASYEHIVFSDREVGNELGTWAPLLFSVVDLPQNNTVYMGGYAGSSYSATEANVKVPVPAGKCWKLRARATTAVPAGQSAILTVRKNGSDQTVTVTLDDSNQWAEDTSNTFTTDDNDLLSVSCVTSATAGTLTIHATLELDRNA